MATTEAKYEWKVDLTQCYSTWAWIGNGMLGVFLFERTFTGPLGVVWGIPSESGGIKSFEVYHSYTIPAARMSGIRRRLNEEILNYYDVVLTVDGTESGLAFMKAAGYKFDDNLKIWYLKKKASRKDGK